MIAREHSSVLAERRSSGTPAGFLTIFRTGLILVTMKTAKSIAAGKFKAECLALLDRVARTGEPLVVTKRGKPVAKVVPIPEAKRSLIGSVKFHGDIVGPILGEWEIDRDHS